MNTGPNRALLPILILVLLLLLPAVGSTADTPPDQAESRQIFITEIHAVLDAQQAALMALHSRFEKAADEAEAVTIQREIQDLHRLTEIQVRQASLRHAQRLGMTRLAERLAAEILDLKNPDRRQNLNKPDQTRQ